MPTQSSWNGEAPPDICVVTSTDVPRSSRSTIYALNPLTNPHTYYSVQYNGGVTDKISIFVNLGPEPICLVTSRETREVDGECVMLLDRSEEFIELSVEVDPKGLGYLGFWWEGLFYTFDAKNISRLPGVEPAPDGPGDDNGDNDDNGGNDDNDDNGGNGDDGGHGNGYNGGNGDGGYFSS